MNKNLNKILISFCIPTYNRAKLVKRCVNKLLEYDGDQIEVVVVNNDSSDNTEEVLSSVKDKRLSYYINDKNVGVVKNIIKTIKYAKGEWVFTLSDEDIVNKDIIKKMIEEITRKKHEGTAVILGNIKKNHSYYNSYYELYKYDNLKYIKGDDAVCAVGFTHRYLSGVLINKKYILEDLKNYSIMSGEIAPHVSLLTRACVKGNAETLDIDFCIMDNKSNKSYVERPNEENYRHPKNRFLQFKYYVNLANDLIENCDNKINKIVSLYQYYLHVSTYGWEWSVSNKKSYFDLNEEIKCDFWFEFKNFNSKATKYLDKIIVDSNDKKKLYQEIKKNEKMFVRNRRIKKVKKVLRPFKPFFKPVYDLIFK